MLEVARTAALSAGRAEPPPKIHFAGRSQAASTGTGTYTVDTYVVFWSLASVQPMEVVTRYEVIEYM